MNGRPRHPLHLVDRLGLHLAGPPGDHVDAGRRRAPRAVHREHRRPARRSVRDLPRVRQRIRNWWRGTKGFREERPNLFVYSPLLLPLPYSRLARWINRVAAAARAAALDARHRLLPADRLDVPADAARARSDRDRRSAADDLLLHRRLSPRARPGAKRIVASEERLFTEADLVFVTSEKLRAARRAVQRARAPVSVRRQPRAVRRGARRRGEPPPADLAALRAADRRLRRRPASVGRSGSARGGRRADAGGDRSRSSGPAQTDVSALRALRERPPARAAAARRRCRAT